MSTSTHDDPLRHPEVQLAHGGQYVVGFVLSLILTALPLWLVVDHMGTRLRLMLVVVASAAALTLVQGYFWLRLDVSPTQRWMTAAFVLFIPLFVMTIEICHRNVRVASHIRSPRRGAHTTVPEHLPKAHRKHLEWSPKRLLAWGASIGPATRTVVDWQLTHKPHPEQGYRACLGLLNLARRYGPARLEAGCLHAVRLGSLTRATVLSILSHGLDSRPLPPETPSDTTTEGPAHKNVRGPDYYH